MTEPVLFYSRSVFSNFYVTEPYVFTLPEACRQKDFPVHFQVRCAETAIMLCKACMMRDGEAVSRLMHPAALGSPSEAKRIGRQVANFDEALWDASVAQVARAAVLAKFTAHPALRQELLATGARPIAEASPQDDRWGIGMAADDPEARDPSKWRGRNLLGRALEEAREILRREDAQEEAGLTE